MHIGDVDGIGINVGGGKWQATVLIYVHDDAGSPVAGATVSGDWSGAFTGAGECTTDATGRCEILADPVGRKNKSLTFTVTGVTHGQLNYLPADNQDPDGDSDGTTIIVPKP